jgi:hypothetical protein
VWYLHCFDAVSARRQRDFFVALDFRFFLNLTEVLPIVSLPHFRTAAWATHLAFLAQSLRLAFRDRDHRGLVRFYLSMFAKTSQFLAPNFPYLLANLALSINPAPG